MSTLVSPDIDVTPSIIQDDDTPWNVIVIDDPVNRIAYVITVLQKIFGFSLDVATQKTMEVHEQGKSVVWSGARPQAEAFRARINAAMLNCMVAQ